MEIPRDLAIERRQRSGAQFSEPVERRGDWNEGSLTNVARSAWDQQQLSVLIDGNEKTVACGLGWFSIGLGLAEVLAPRTLERFLGIKHHGFLLRVMGLREIASGVGILTGRRPSGWLWARAGGDVIDIAALGMALNPKPTINLPSRSRFEFVLDGFNQFLHRWSHREAQHRVALRFDDACRLVNQFKTDRFQTV